jgi:hypothetical protein
MYYGDKKLKMSLLLLEPEDKAIIHCALWLNQNEFFKIMNLVELNQIHYEIINQFTEALRN